MARTIAEGRKIVSGLRDSINEMGSLQMKNFFNGFDMDQLKLMQKHITKAQEAKKEKYAADIQKKIDALKSELENL